MDMYISVPSPHKSGQRSPSLLPCPWCPYISEELRVDPPYLSFSSARRRLSSPSVSPSRLLLRWISRGPPFWWYTFSGWIHLEHQIRWRSLDSVERSEYKTVCRVGSWNNPEQCRTIIVYRFCHIYFGGFIYNATPLSTLYKFWLQCTTCWTNYAWSLYIYHHTYRRFWEYQKVLSIRNVYVCVGCMWNCMWNMYVEHVWGTCMGNMYVEHVCGTCMGNMYGEHVCMCMELYGEHVCGTCMWNMYVEHVCGTCMWNMYVEHVCGTCMWNMYVELYVEHVWGTVCGTVCGTCMWNMYVELYVEHVCGTCMWNMYVGIEFLFALRLRCENYRAGQFQSMTKLILSTFIVTCMVKCNMTCIVMARVSWRVFYV